MAWSEDEPVRGAYADPALLALGGLERMQAGLRGLMPAPPIAHLFGLAPVTVEAEELVFRIPASPWLQAAPGPFFAGTAALVADAPLGGAVLARLGPGQLVVTSDLSFNFLRPTSTESKELVCRARPIEVGNRLGFAEGIVEDGSGRAVAHCTTRCFVFKVDAPASPELPVVEEPDYETPDPYLRPVSHDPIPKAMWDEKSFIEILEHIKDNDIEPAPFAKLFAIDDVDASEGRFTSSMRATGWHASPAGTVYGGVLAYLADTVLTGALSSTLATSEIVAPLDLKVQFLRPVPPDGRRLRAVGEVVHRGRNFAAAQVKITNEEGKTVVLGYSSAVVIGGRSWGSFVVADEAPAPSA
jgi:uncharacterized protein (TIGR00369 family)